MARIVAGGRAEFPILVKFIFPEDKLSIQVHPDDAYASAHEQAAGGRGKTEMWHAVAAQPDAQVLIGLKPQVTREQFLAAIAAHTVEALFEAHPVRPGDTFFIPAGTPHAIGPHMVLCEIQEYSDLTYRVYDYGRTDAHGNPRELHIEKALEVTDFANSAPGGRVRAPQAADSKGHLLAACHFFSAVRQDFQSRLDTQSNPFRFEALIVLSGNGVLVWEDQETAYQAGECWFIPASLGRFSLTPEAQTSIIRSTVRTWQRCVANCKNAVCRRKKSQRYCLRNMADEKLPIHAIILAGGRGTRFWPRSRTRTPKQLLNIVGDTTMLEQTVERLLPVVPARRIWTVTNTEQAAAVQKQVPAAARKRVLSEPIGRNTAAAIALAAFHVRHAEKGGDALLAVLPADHYFADAPGYRKIVSAALSTAREPGRMVVLGIPPTRPDTGFGYIERIGDAAHAKGFPVFAVKRFTEKPQQALAQEYLESGKYQWNAGMFFWRVSTFLDNLRKYVPKTVARWKTWRGTSANAATLHS